MAALVVRVATVLAVLAGPALAQQTPSSFALDILRGAVSDDAAKQAPRPAARADQGPGGVAGQVSLVAAITEEGQKIDRGLVWRVYASGGADGKPRLVTTNREPTPTLQLPAGDYLVNAAFGRANLTRKITVAAAAQTTEQFIISVGMLKVTALLSNAAPAPPGAVYIDVFSDDRDQFGQRTRVIAGARPGRLFRLNSGLYQIVSQYGDANSTVQAELTVEPGKLTDATVTHHAARVTFRLVTRAGGEAIAETEWTILNRQGEIVKESAGALPTHTLAPGTYTANARSQGNSFRRAFAVKSGETVQIEVMAQ